MERDDGAPGGRRRVENGLVHQVRNEVRGLCRNGPRTSRQLVGKIRILVWKTNAKWLIDMTGGFAQIAGLTIVEFSQ